jgi:hypothetical protein
LSAIYCTPGPLNSNLIKIEKAVPSNPENNAKIRYNVPISLAFEDKNHLSVHKDILEFKRETPDLLPSYSLDSLDQWDLRLRVYEKEDKQVV